jgi:hypothetical protein
MQIDATDADNWKFPVGTKFWKEFCFSSQRVETRMIEKISETAWTFQAFAWNDDESDAVLVPSCGSRNCAAIDEGLRHDIPSVNDCKACHEGTGRDVVLGFNALQLSQDRDSLAPHAEPKTAEMIDLRNLIDQGRLAHLSADFANHPPRIHADSPRERAALGYLRANCGGCHNAADPISSVGMILQSPLYGDPAVQQSYRETVIGHLSKYQIPDLAAGESYRVLPGDPSRSSVVYRMGTRNPFRQMPALGTKIVDQQAVDLLTQWIKDDLGHHAQANK